MSSENTPKRTKKPWPTKAAMEQVYEMKLWGGSELEFYSGNGSHDIDIVKPYIEVVVSFLTSFKKLLIVCDLGCGDFNIGKSLVRYTKQYKAIDIVESLIEYNRENFKTANVEFHCLDIAIADIPYGDCAIIRQVLQHLSNTEVQQVLLKLTDFKHVILTEHVPLGDFVPNADIISGQGIRLKKKSGLDVLKAPFNFKVLNSEQLLAVKLKDGKGVIVTTLYNL